MNILCKLRTHRLSLGPLNVGGPRDSPAGDEGVASGPLQVKCDLRRCLSATRE